MDATGLVNLESRCERLFERKAFVVLAGVQPQPAALLARAGIRAEEGKVELCPTLQAAIEVATARVAAAPPASDRPQLGPRRLSGIKVTLSLIFRSRPARAASGEGAESRAGGPEGRTNRRRGRPNGPMAKRQGAGRGGWGTARSWLLLAAGCAAALAGCAEREDGRSAAVEGPPPPPSAAGAPATAAASPSATATASGAPEQEVTAKGRAQNGDSYKAPQATPTAVAEAPAVPSPRPDPGPQASGSVDTKLEAARSPDRSGGSPVNPFGLGKQAGAKDRQGEAAIDPNGRFATTYRPGGGHLAAFESAVARGVVPPAEREIVSDVGARYAPE